MTPLSPREAYDLPNNGSCPDCGNPLEVAPGTPPHHAMAVCIDCGDGLNSAFRGWLPDPKKPDRPKERRDANAAWRVMHQDLDGSVMCVMCLVDSNQKTGCSFDVDHVIPREEGGPDTYENTRILCSDCHQIRHALIRAVQHLRRPPAA